MPQATGPVLNPLAITDDSQIVYALQNLPSVDLPPIEQLFVLLIAYIALIGPINYLVLRRLDKREWAWVTIPALVVVFAFGSYGLGATLKGSDVIVNQITVVRAAQGTGRGIGQAYIGVYSPSRRTLRRPHSRRGAPLQPGQPGADGQTETPLDVIFGERTRACATSRSASACCAASAPRRPPTRPRSTAICGFVGGKLAGTITNRSDRCSRTSRSCSAAASPCCPTLGPGETQGDRSRHDQQPVLRLRAFGAHLRHTFPRDSAQARTVTTRRTVIDQLFPWGSQGSPTRRFCWRGATARSWTSSWRATAAQSSRRRPVHDPAGA